MVEAAQGRTQGPPRIHGEASEFVGKSAEVAEWQTRRSQKPMSARTCGFDSRSRHHVGLTTGCGGTVTVLLIGRLKAELSRNPILPMLRALGSAADPFLRFAKEGAMTSPLVSETAAPAWLWFCRRLQFLQQLAELLGAG